MDDRITILPATAEDAGAIRALLGEADLPLAGFDAHLRTFVVARDGDAVIGCGGAETYPNAALIRSIAVRPQYRGTGVGRLIVRQLIDRLSSRGLRDFYLLTTTAEDYFVKRGFRKIERSEVHPDVTASEEFRGACPASAVCMRLRIL